jgi:hypothetical protein
MRRIIIARTPDGRYLPAATDQENAGLWREGSMNEGELVTWMQNIGITGPAAQKTISELRDAGHTVIVRD